MTPIHALHVLIRRYNHPSGPFVVVALPYDTVGAGIIDDDDDSETELEIERAGVSGRAASASASASPGRPRPGSSSLTNFVQPPMVYRKRVPRTGSPTAHAAMWTPDGTLGFVVGFRNVGRIVFVTPVCERAIGSVCVHPQVASLRRPYHPPRLPPVHDRCHHPALVHRLSPVRLRSALRHPLACPRFVPHRLPFRWRTSLPAATSPRP